MVSLLLGLGVGSLPFVEEAAVPFALGSDMFIWALFKADFLGGTRVADVLFGKGGNLSSMHLLHRNSSDKPKVTDEPRNLHTSHVFTIMLQGIQMC